VGGSNAEDGSWQLAISLIAAWRENDAAHSQRAVAQRLAEAVAEGGGTAVDQAVVGLTAVANMFIELYADCAGSSVDAVLREAESLRHDN
jgi:hypothetical protein